MTPPLINYVTFNRLGLTQKSLSSILDTPEDFEMHIIDSNSKDNSWDYIQSLNDPRIKSKTRFPLNCGAILPGNFNLTKRAPDQYFFNIDSDVYMKTKNWISCFMDVFNTFPEVGLLGVPRGNPYPQLLPMVLPRTKGDIGYLQLRNGFVDTILDFIPGHCACLRPELISQVGYWSEENCYGDAELSIRVNHYTTFKAGFTTNVDIDMTQFISCEECKAKEWCKLDRDTATCFTLRSKGYRNESAAVKFKPKYLECFKELEEGKRTAFCASMYDAESMKKYLYHKDWAQENINFFIENGN